MTWQPIETAPKGKKVILYQPERPGRLTLEARVLIDTAPTHPRKSTHWMHLPPPPETAVDNEGAAV